jgi:hypothetical protein
MYSMKSGFLLVFLVLVTASGMAFAPLTQIVESDPAGVEGDTLGNYTTGDGLDYATRVLGDAWDMSEFYDISQGLNTLADPNQHLANIQVSDGIFSASSVGTYSEFFPLFPGYPPGTHSGKIGALYPINSSVFGCFYMAMKSTWPINNLNAFYVGWGANDDTNKPSGIAQSSNINPISNGQWMLHQINLNSAPLLPGYQTKWSTQPWQYLRITSSMYAGTQFSIDWIRLTNCQPVYVNLTGLSSGTYSLWLSTSSHDGQVLVVNSFSTTGSYNWDVQGLAAGSYTYYVKSVDGSSVKYQGQVSVVESPIVTFTSPSEYSGQDYANSMGNPWDMNDSSDAPYINCVKSADFSNGILTLITGSRQCQGPGANEADPKIFLNSADHGNLASYRYLSFRSSTTGYPWSVPQLGMIVRLFWSLDRPGLDCWYGSRAVALDVGWQTYMVDLYDAWNGLPEEKTPADCPNVSWRDQASVGPVVAFRIDPNENITGVDMLQEFDWIRLTKVEQVSQGASAKIRVLLNKPPSEVNLNFYYTTDLSQPTQHPASTYPQAIIAAPYHFYLPLVVNSDLNFDPFVSQLPADVTFSWDTSGVTPREYYICAQANDNYNQAIYCSHAPIQINP